MTVGGCFFCDTNDGELRPYGPGGSPLCFACLKETPEREAAAGRAFAIQIEASEVVGEGVSVLDTNGPRPSTEAERELLEQEWLNAWNRARG